MMRNSLWNRDLFDGFMNDMFEDDFFGGKNPLYGKHARNMMKTDIRETDEGYELDIDLPGFKKDEIQAELKNGYLTVSAAKGLDKDEQNKKGEYIRRERYTGSMSRSFYVGEHLNEEDIKAKYEDFSIIRRRPCSPFTIIKLPGIGGRRIAKMRIPS